MKSQVFYKGNLKSEWLWYFSKMYRKDQIKGIIALILFGVIGVTYLLTGNDDLIVTVSIVALIIWLVSMYILNRRF